MSVLANVALSVTASNLLPNSSAVSSDVCRRAPYVSAKTELEWCAVKFRMVEERAA